MAASWQEAIQKADIVCATTHPKEPIVCGKWLHDGQHINSVGVAQGALEVDLEAITRSNVFVEARCVATSPMPAGSDELYQAVQAGKIHIEDLTEVGEVVTSLRSGRTDPKQITLYKSIGNAVQDAAAASLVLAATAAAA